MGSVGKILGWSFLAFVVIVQLFPVDRSNPKSDPSLEIKAPAKIQAIFERSCYDCHSNKTVWPWYSHIAPMKWFVTNDVHTGRQWLNFSVWNSYDAAKKRKLREEMFTAVAMAMPLGMYLKAHPYAKLSREDMDAIRKWTGVTPREIMSNPKGHLY